jgi:hypothetical protein
MAKSNPGNVGWERDLAISYTSIGDVQMAQGDLPGARASYRDGLVVSERLTKFKPGNADRQRNLAVLHFRVS